MSIKRSSLIPLHRDSRKSPAHLPPATRAAIQRLEAAEDERLAELVGAVLEGDIPSDRMAEPLFVLAALQVELGKLASLLDPGGLVPVGEGICTACGAPPVASLVVGWPGAQGARYLVRSLRPAAWNHVRITCAGCASTKGIAYYGIEGRDEVARGETCEACRGYLKRFQQQKDPLVDPVADDVATPGLDLPLRKAGWHRLGRNPFLLGT